MMWFVCFQKKSRSRPNTEIISCLEIFVTSESVTSREIGFLFTR